MRLWSSLLSNSQWIWLTSQWDTEAFQGEAAYLHPEIRLVQAHFFIYIKKNPEITAYGT